MTLEAVAINFTLKRSGKESSWTDAMIELIAPTHDDRHVPGCAMG